MRSSRNSRVLLLAYLHHLRFDDIHEAPDKFALPLARPEGVNAKVSYAPFWQRVYKIPSVIPLCEHHAYSAAQRSAREDFKGEEIGRVHRLGNQAA